MYQYPLSLSFKIIAIAPQVKVMDASGKIILYVRQKALALKESVPVFSDEKQQNQLYEIKADRVIDFSANYGITKMDGQSIGKLSRKGARSIWKATYPVSDSNGIEVGLIHEENPWMKVLDSVVGEIPFAGMFINPAYLIDIRDQTMLYLKKEPAVFESKFRVEKRGEFSDAEEELLLTSLLMMLLLERSRG